MVMKCLHFPLQVADEISELKLGNGTSVLIFANIASALPSSVGAAMTQVRRKVGCIWGWCGWMGGGGVLLLGRRVGAGASEQVLLAE